MDGVKLQQYKQDIKNFRKRFGINTTTHTTPITFRKLTPQNIVRGLTHGNSCGSRSHSPNNS